jgi:serine/threonine protein kinase
MMAESLIAQRYRVGRAIGVGGMGFVYEALDLQTGLEVALKALPPGSPDPVRLRRLRREAAAGSSIKSQHVCRVHYLGVERGTPFIVMERLRGHTLRTQLDTYGPPSTAEAVAITSQLLQALHATHAVGVIHRDVKPSNLFIVEPNTEAARLKLIDFGLCKIKGNSELNQRDGGGPGDITSAECLIGTIQYVAPEQLLGVGEADERTDVYAAGVTLYELLTGRRAFSGGYADIVHDICLGEVPRVSVVRPELALFDDVLAMALAKTRERRFASARAFHRALLAVDHEARETARLVQSGVCQSYRGAGHDEVVELEDDDLEDVPTVRPPAPLVDEEPTVRYSMLTSTTLANEADAPPTPRHTYTDPNGRHSRRGGG